MRSRPWRRCWSWCGTVARHCRWARCWQWTGRIRANANVIDVLLVLASVRVEVECSSIRDIATSLVGNDGDVIADLTLVRPAFLGVKSITHRHVRRPCDAGICAVGVE